MKTETAASLQRRRSKGTPLRRTLALWFCLITLLACVSLGCLTYFLRASALREMVFNQLEMVRDDKARNIGAWIDDRRADIDLWSARPDILRMCQEHQRGQTADIPDNRAYLEKPRKGYKLAAIFLADPATGRAFVAAGPQTTDSYHLTDQYRTQVAQSRRTVISEALLDRSTNRPEMFVAAPVLSASEKEVVGIVTFVVDLSTEFYPLFSNIDQLGDTGEALLVNRNGLVQSPLRFAEHAIGKLTINAEPARLAAAGQIGRIATGDYRSVPVMAAFGHIDGVEWGLVVKQDMAELNAPVRAMAWQVAGVSLAVLVLAACIGIFVAAKVAGPIAHVAAVVEAFGAGDHTARAEEAGSTEMRSLAASTNLTAEILVRQFWVKQAINDIYAVTGTHSTTATLLDAILPRIMDATRSQLGVAYLAAGDGSHFQCVLAHGIAQQRIAQQINTSPPDHFLADAAAACKVRVTAGIPEENDLLIVTQAGESRPRSLLSIPLVHAGRTIGVLGFASLYDYRKEDLELAETLNVSLGQSVATCLASEETQRVAEELRTNNEELNCANSELRSTMEELEQQAEELEAQRKALDEANRLKSQFLSNMSHELRTPLNSVMALSQLMLSRGPGKNPQQEAEYLEIIGRNGRHLLSLINDVLDLSKIEAGHMDSVITDFDPRDVMERVVDTVQPLAEEKGLAIRVHIDNVSTIRSDEEKVHQILLNLLSNAVKFTAEGEIEVAVKTVDEQVSFAVRDTGIGIAEADLTCIFDEFRQVDGTTTRRHEGTGLGLAIGRKLARLLGGKITVTSTPGQGSTFSLILPVRCSVTQQETRIIPSPATVPSSTPYATSLKRTVLVIDDDHETCDLLKGYLTEAGYDVAVAHNGREGLQLAREIRPFAITLDVLMPEMDGWEVIGELKASTSTANIPVIVVSVNGDRSTGVAMGAASHVIKPLDKHVFLAEIERQMPAGSRLPRTRVLVVEDNEIAALQVRSALEEAEYTVTVASGGVEALASIKQAVPDVVVLDLMMPEIDGFQVLEQIRLSECTARVPVLVLTAKDLSAEDRARLTLGHVQQLVQKGSINRDQLVACVAGLLPKPLAAAPPMPVPSKPSTPMPLPSVSPQSNHTILIVEDNPDNMFTIKAILDELDCSYITAEDGLLAVKAANESCPGLILMDVQLPGLSGLDATRQIKMNPAMSHIPIIALTARAMKGDRETALAAGCDDYLTKPLDTETVITVIRKWLPDAAPVCGGNKQLVSGAST